MYQYISIYILIYIYIDTVHNIFRDILDPCFSQSTHCYEHPTSKVRQTHWCPQSCEPAMSNRFCESGMFRRPAKSVNGKDRMSYKNIQNMKNQKATA